MLKLIRKLIKKFTKKKQDKVCYLPKDVIEKIYYENEQ